MPRIKEHKTMQKRPQAPAMSVEEREQEIRLLAMDVSEARLRNGEASSQEIVYWLKDGSSKQQLEIENLRKEIELKDAKISALESEQESAVKYQAALEAFTKYAGHSND